MQFLKYNTANIYYKNMTIKFTYVSILLSDILSQYLHFITQANYTTFDL